MTLTLQAIKDEQAKLAAMIAEFERLQTYPKTIHAPQLADDEKHIGTLISADGQRCEHLILLAGEFEGPWEDALGWAEAMGGQLPDRVESAPLFAHATDDFKPEWYWTRDQPADTSDGAWYQDFDHGYQNYLGTINRLRACAVRREPV